MMITWSTEKTDLQGDLRKHKNMEIRDKAENMKNLNRTKKIATRTWSTG